MLDFSLKYKNPIIGIPAIQIIKVVGCSVYRITNRETIIYLLKFLKACFISKFLNVKNETNTPKNIIGVIERNATFKNTEGVSLQFVPKSRSKQSIEIKVQGTSPTTYIKLKKSFKQEGHLKLKEALDVAI
eukprot:403342559